MSAPDEVVDAPPARPPRPDVSLRTRFWLLTALRWVPTGLLIPVTVLLPLDRGLTLAQVGTTMAFQGVVVLLLELPTGSLTDTLGRRPVLLISAAVALVAILVTSAATTFWGFALAWALMGAFRALDSGPLEAWFVDAERAAGADRSRIARGLTSAGSVTGVGIAAGALAAGGLIVWAPHLGAPPLVLPLWVAAGIVALQLTAAAVLLTDPPRVPGSVAPRWTTTLRDGVRMVARRGPLRRLAGVSALTGIGMCAFELMMPVRLAEFTGQAIEAGAAMGPVTSAAWAVSAAGAGLTAAFTRRFTPRSIAVCLLALQVVAVVGMAVAGGPATLVAAFLAVYLVHTGAGSTVNALVHDEVADSHRATALSIMSLAMQSAGAVATVTLGLVADRSGPPAALVVGAIAIAAGATLLAARPAQPARLS